jgi:recombination protein RecA
MEDKTFEQKIKELEKIFGKGQVSTLEGKKLEVDTISSQSIGLDLALGVGGFPKGRIVEIYGPESSGKTTLTLHAIAQCQSEGGRCAFVDAEHAFDPDYARAIGINTNELFFFQPSSGEEGLNYVEGLIDTGEFQMIVVDSVAALTPQAEIEGDMGDNRLGLHARLMSQACRKLAGKVHTTGCILIFINQLREKIGVMFGSPEVTTGGNALKFYASIRLDIRRSVTAANSVMEGDKKVGNLTKVKVIKNKVAPPFGECEFDILYGEGFDKVSELLEIGVKSDVIIKDKNTYLYGDVKLGVGKDSVKELLDDNSDLFDNIKKDIYKKHGI